MSSVVFSDVLLLPALPAHIRMYVCVCVCVCVWRGVGGGEGSKYTTKEDAFVFSKTCHSRYIICGGIINFVSLFTVICCVCLTNDILKLKYSQCKV